MLCTRVLEPNRKQSSQIQSVLTYSMVQSPSWEANWFAASQKIPRISRNPKVHYRTHKRPPHVSILGQPNPVHIPTSHLLEIHPNIIHPSASRSPQWSPSLRFPQQDNQYATNLRLKKGWLFWEMNILNLSHSILHEVINIFTLLSDSPSYIKTESVLNLTQINSVQKYITSFEGQKAICII